MAPLPLKRKTKPSQSSVAKRLKTKHILSDDLPWKSISKPHQADFGTGLDGFLELEEVEGVGVEYEVTDGGRVVRFTMSESQPEPLLGEPSEPKAPETQRIPTPVTFDAETLLPAWHAFAVHPQLGLSLYTKKFLHPTPIQSQTLPFALNGRDVVGIAETGSGKTLAYGLPILHLLLTDAYTRPISSSKVRRPVRALILAPTRELALQVSSHLNSCLTPVEIGAEQGLEVPDTSNKTKKKSKGKGKAEAPPTEVKAPPLVSVAAIVGGMSRQKQHRILSRGVDVLVATPGRLWDLLQEDDELLSQLGHLRFLVLDEADRMIETGHFAELDNILQLTSLKSQSTDTEGVGEKLQTFIFSATLSRDLQMNLKDRLRRRKKNEKKSVTTLDELIQRLDFRDPDPVVVDINPIGNVVATLSESRVECLSVDKDAYLYYFLLRYPGRTLVFLSAIDGIRRLLPLLELLGVSALPLHSQLEQRQRLKNLDRFKSTSKSVLLATDIAARGLDIPAVDHVVHYQAPRTADTYIHRNGRTARATRSGFSLLMCAPEETKMLRALMHELGRQIKEIAEMPVELCILDRVKARIQLARQIELSHHKEKKAKHERKWVKELAEAMDIELDSDLASDEDTSRRERKVATGGVAALKAELQTLLSQPLVVRGVSMRYITSGSRSVADEMIGGQQLESIVGLRSVGAAEDMIPRRVE